MNKADLIKSLNRQYSNSRSPSHSPARSPAKPPNTARRSPKPPPKQPKKNVPPLPAGKGLPPPPSSKPIEIITDSNNNTSNTQIPKNRKKKAPLTGAWMNTSSNNSSNNKDNNNLSSDNNGNKDNNSNGETWQTRIRNGSKIGSLAVQLASNISNRSRSKSRESNDTVISKDLGHGGPGQAHQGIVARNRRIFDDMDSDESDISEFSIFGAYQTPGGPNDDDGKTKGKKGGKTKNKHDTSIHSSKATKATSQKDLQSSLGQASLDEEDRHIAGDNEDNNGNNNGNNNDNNKDGAPNNEAMIDMLYGAGMLQPAPQSNEAGGQSPQSMNGRNNNRPGGVPPPPPSGNGNASGHNSGNNNSNNRSQRSRMGRTSRRTGGRTRTTRPPPPSSGKTHRKGASLLKRLQMATVAAASNAFGAQQPRNGGPGIAPELVKEQSYSQSATKNNGGNNSARNSGVYGNNGWSPYNSHSPNNGMYPGSSPNNYNNAYNSHYANNNNGQTPTFSHQFNNEQSLSSTILPMPPMPSPYNNNNNNNMNNSNMNNGMSSPFEHMNNILAQQKQQQEQIEQQQKEIQQMRKSIKESQKQQKEKQKQKQKRPPPFIPRKSQSQTQSQSQLDRPQLSNNHSNSQSESQSQSQSQSRSQSGNNRHNVRVTVTQHEMDHGNGMNGMNGMGIMGNRFSKSRSKSRASTVFYTDKVDKVKSPLYFNQNSKSDDIVVSRFPHARPIPGTKYFHELNGISDGLSIVIPFFNETATELEITLKTIYYSYQYLCFELPEWRKKPFNVCIVQDGWYKAHTSMKRYLKKMFPKKFYNLEEKSDEIDPKSNFKLGAIKQRNRFVSAASSTSGGQFWWDYFKEFTKYDQKRDGSVTFIIEKTLDNPTFFQIRFKDKDNALSKEPKYQLKMNLTLIIKIDNRRKHNSHEWFMGKDGFADATHSKYFLATDAFTIFDKRCLYYLVNYMEQNPKCCACTGRQRAMSRRQQGLREREWVLSMDYILRQTQRCDFELSTCVYNPAYSLVGFLPVIPGPCGMYRCCDALQDSARGWYFDVINASPSETGLVLGNLRIAEDRVLSYASVLKIAETKYMGYVDEAMFYFEAETNLDSFLYQRRRWINGTFAGYWYLLISNPSHFWQWRANFFRKYFVWLLLWVSLIQMFGIMISPAISFTILEQGLSFLMRKITENGSVGILIQIIMGIVWTIWVAHVIVHNQQKFHPIIMQFLYFLSVLTSLTFAGSYFVLFAIEQKTIYEALMIRGMTPELLQCVIVLMICAAALPVTTNFLISADLKGVWVLLKSFFAYFLSFHMMIPWFSSYSYARCWDLSWGNRPTSAEHEPASNAGQLDSDIDLIGNNVDITDVMKAKFLQFSRVVAAILIISNFGVYFMPFFWKAMIMSFLLLTGVIFMILSLFVLSLKFPKKIYKRYVKPICRKFCCCCCCGNDSRFEE